MGGRKGTGKAGKRKGRTEGRQGREETEKNEKRRKSSFCGEKKRRKRKFDQILPKQLGSPIFPSPINTKFPIRRIHAVFFLAKFCLHREKPPPYHDLTKCSTLGLGGFCIPTPSLRLSKSNLACESIPMVYSSTLSFTSVDVYFLYITTYNHEDLTNF